MNSSQMMYHNTIRDYVVMHGGTLLMSSACDYGHSTVLCKNGHKFKMSQRDFDYICPKCEIANIIEMSR